MLPQYATTEAPSLPTAAPPQHICVRAARQAIPERDSAARARRLRGRIMVRGVVNAWLWRCAAPVRDRDVRDAARLSRGTMGVTR